MTTREEWFLSHEVHRQLASVSEKLETVRQDSEGADVLDPVDHLHRVLDHTVKVLGILDPSLVPVKQLDKAAQVLTNIDGNLNNFLSNQDPAHLQQTLPQADNLLVHLQSIPGADVLPDLEGLAESASRYQQSFNKLADALKQGREEAKQEFESLSLRVAESEKRLESQDQYIQAQKERVDKIITDFQSQFSTAQEEHRSKFAEMSDKRTKDFNAFLEEHRTHLQKLLVDGGKKADELFAQHSQEVETRIKALEDRTEELHSEYDKEAQTVIAELKDTDKKAKELLGLVRDTAVTGNYDTIASQERRSANIWRWIALFFFTAMVVTALATVHFLVKEGFDWKIALFRLATSLIIGIPGVFAARESARHRARERRKRKYQLELAAIDPYLESLDPNERQRIKAELTTRMFGVPEEVTQDVEALTKNPLFNLLETVLKNLTKK